MYTDDFIQYLLKYDRIINYNRVYDTYEILSNEENDILKIYYRPPNKPYFSIVTHTNYDLKKELKIYNLITKND